MQKLTILGNMGKDPEKRSTQTGVQVVSFSLAVNIKKDLTVWYEVTIWEHKIPIFERILPHLKKGTRLIIGGSLMPVEMYRANDGNMRTKLRIEPDYIQFAGGGKDEKKEEGASVFDHQPPADEPFEEDPDLPF